ncbi:putative short-chain dehydrogenase [Stachybotrys elegans]|uniref:Short-chain dehydrogenase n=1 Tax=Stachybotrys elegans TaxID=80388 RepID=A0A8K0SFJ1_9HYPO|nr:putative short-chain dehydrogenase [Stachybotrys elegans]
MTPSTSNPLFGPDTEATEVAQAFATGIQGKTIIVTGVNRGGIGYSTCEAFASQSPAHLIVTGRNEAKVKESMDALRKSYPDVGYRPLLMDLSSQQSVREAATKLLNWEDVPKIDILVNSAGVALIPDHTLSVDRIEQTFATNHMGHFLFTCCIMPKLVRAAENSTRGAVRIVNVTSRSPLHSRMRWSDVNFTTIMNKDLPVEEQPNWDLHKAWQIEDSPNKIYIPLEAYNQSKVANVLFSIAATTRLYEKYGILSLAVHPGVIATELGRDASSQVTKAIENMMKQGAVKYKSLGAGAATSLVAALDPCLGPGRTVGDKENVGVYLYDCQICDKGHPLAMSSSQAERLWKLSEELVKEEFSW